MVILTGSDFPPGKLVSYQLMQALAHYYLPHLAGVDAHSRRADLHKDVRLTPNIHQRDQDGCFPWWFSEGDSVRWRRVMWVESWCWAQ